MENKRSWRKWLWYFTLLAATVLLYRFSGNLVQIWGVFGTLGRILMPFLIGIGLAFLLYGPSHWLETRFLRHKGKLWLRLSRPLSLVIVYIVLFGLLVLFGYLIIPQLISSITGLVTGIPHYLAVAKERLEEFTRPGGWLARMNLVGRANDVFDALISGITKFFTTENIVSAVRGVISATTSLVDAVIVIMVSIYTLTGRERIIRDVKSLLGLFFRDHHVRLIGDYSHRVAHIFYGYFYGSFVDAMLVGIVASIGLAIFRVPYAILLGMTLGLLNMIPYFGSLIGGVGIVLITLLTKNIYAAIGIAIYILVLQQIDGNIVQPHIVGDSVGLRPIYVLLAITLFGGLFGFWGIFLGVPLMAVIQMLVKDGIAAKKRKRAEKPNETDGE